jgi:CubicO group peptidase (beta-lactamase class C family)
VTSRKLLRRWLASVAILGALAAPLLASTRPAVAAGESAAASTAGTDLPEAKPAEVGVDPQKLVQLSGWLREQNLDVRSLLLVKDDKLVLERYTGGLNRDYNYELYSITKGVAAILAGMLIDEGKLHLDDKVGDVIAKWRPDLAGKFADKQDLKVRHILTMSSGLHYDFKPKDDPIYYEAPDRLALAADTQPKVPPGKEFEYTDINPILTAAVLSAAAGMPIQEYGRQKLFEPLDMKNYAWGRADKKGLVSTGWGLRLRPMDMAKIGLLVLHHGRWQGKQLVSAGWIDQMTSPGVVPYFGDYWWINDIVASEPEYDTMGFKGQFIVALPKRDAVVVMTSLLPIEGGLRDAKNVQIFRQIMNDYVVPALDAKAGPAGGQAEADAEKALANELATSEQSHPAPGATPDPYETDTPRK